MMSPGIVTEDDSRSVLRAIPEDIWRKRTGPVIYFIGPEDGPIKIGRTANLRARMSQLQSGNMTKLHVWAFTSGNNLDEALRHGWYAAHRITGEWFARHSDILAEIERLGAGA